MIHFVGAGPGAPDLITVRGRERLEKADVVIYAGSLVSPQVLSWCREDCRRYDSAYLTLPEVLELMEDASREGLDVVRLHTGDPCLYGALQEQLDALREKGIPYDLCPGVSSFCGAAAALETEYTLPGVSQSVLISRAPGRTGVPERERLEKLAAHQATMVLFLSMGETGEVSRRLIEGGYPPDTPAAIVYKATWPEQRVLRTTLRRLPETASKSGISRTALIVVGKVLESAYAPSRLYAPEAATGFRKETARRGVFYGVGVGAGDPEDLTCKAVRTLKAAQVIACLKSRAAYEIAAAACPEIRQKALLELELPMTRDLQTREAAYQTAARAVAQTLREGKDVAMPVLGDPMLYASAGRLGRILKQMDCPVVWVNGIPSFARAAAEAGMPLAQGGETLHLLPGADVDVEEALALPGTKVFLKPGGNLARLADCLNRPEEGKEREICFAERAGWPDGRIVRRAEQMPKQAGYYTLVIVREGGAD